MAVVNVPFRESVVTFGERAALVGILTMPAKVNAGAPTVILLNSGVIHRVGANRIHVAFARTLAMSGIPALRFDLSGIGDSERGVEGDSLQESVHTDITAAIEFVVAANGTPEVALIGLCSGASDAFDHALRDPRVVAAAMLDMPGPFRNWSHSAAFVGARLFQPVSWSRRVTAFAQMSPLLARARGSDRPKTPLFLPGVRGTRSLAEMREQLGTLLSRGVKLAFLFTGGFEDQYNHRHQFRIRFARFAAHRALRVEFAPWSDHTLSTLNARAYFADWLRQWVVDELTIPRDADKRAASRAANPITA